MLNAYYLIEDGQQIGPFSHHELMDRGIGAEDLVLSPISNQWESAASMFEFAGYFDLHGIYFPTQAVLASFWWRLLAYLIDFIVILLTMTSFAALLGIVLAFTGGHSLNSDFGNDTPLLQNMIWLIADSFYNAIFETSRLQGSIGKVVCKLKVVNSSGERLDFAKALGRNFGKILSSLICGLGFLCILWDKNKQGWHDQLAKTFVIRKP